MFMGTDVEQCMVRGIVEDMDSHELRGIPLPILFLLLSLLN